MNNGKSAFVTYSNYSTKIDPYIEKIKNSNGRKIVSDESYAFDGGWNARKNGLYVRGNANKLFVSNANGMLTIKAINIVSSWKEWVKTLKEDELHLFTINHKEDGFVLSVSDKLCNTRPLQSLFNPPSGT